MKKVVSFCLWGTNPHYLDGAIRALATAREFYPDWEYWFYLAEDVPGAVVAELANQGAKVIRMNRADSQGASVSKTQYLPAFWRFLPASDPGVEILIVRDVDSIITAREVAAVQEWLTSGLDFHIMRDHPKHEYPIMAGMWGGRARCLNDIAALISQWGRFDYYGCDQDFLGKVVYPRLRDSAWIHSECIEFPKEKPHRFPVDRAKDEFIGASFTGDDRYELQVRYLREWLASGSPKVVRPLPWSLQAKARSLMWRISKIWHFASR